MPKPNEGGQNPEVLVLRIADPTISEGCQMDLRIADVVLQNGNPVARRVADKAVRESCSGDPPEIGDSLQKGNQADR